MELYQIRYFVALCDESSFTRAAKRCAVSQPSLTNGILSLEKELGRPLFYRKPLVHLTPLGAILRPYFEQILENLNEAKSAAERQLLGGVPGVLNSDGPGREPETGDLLPETAPHAVNPLVARLGGDGNARP